MSGWKTIFSLFGSSQSAQSRELGIPQQRISEKITGQHRASKAEMLAVLVAGLALAQLTQREKEHTRLKALELFKKR
jgi:hypothetical protein